MLELIKKDYLKKTIPAHYTLYNVSNEKIEGLKDEKFFQLPKIHFMEFNKGAISKEELEKQYLRGLESRGQHLISLDYGPCNVLVCNCKNYKHNDNCAMQYLKKYMKLKNHTIEKYK